MGWEVRGRAGGSIEQLGDIRHDRNALKAPPPPFRSSAPEWLSPFRQLSTQSQCQQSPTPSVNDRKGRGPVHFADDVSTARPHHSALTPPSPYAQRTVASPPLSLPPLLIPLPLWSPSSIDHCCCPSSRLARSPSLYPLLLSLLPLLLLLHLSSPLCFMRLYYVGLYRQVHGSGPPVSLCAPRVGVQSQRLRLPHSPPPPPALPLHCTADHRRTSELPLAAIPPSRWTPQLSLSPTCTSELMVLRDVWSATATTSLSQPSLC